MSGKAIQVLERTWILLFLPLMIAAGIFGFHQKPVLVVPFALFVLISAAWLVSALGWQTYLLRLIAFFLPLSVEIPLTGNAMIFIPTEPLAGIALFTIALDFIRKPSFMLEVIGRESRWVLPLVLAFLISIPFSVMPIVSVKFAVVNVSYILVFFILIAYQLRHKPGFFPELMAWYSIGLFIVLLYAMFRFYEFGWNPVVVKGIFLPFYRDHTILGATVAITGTFWIAYAFTQKHFIKGILMLIAGIAFIVVVFLSASRAAILSIGVFVIFAGMLWLKFRIRHLIVMALAASLIVVAFHQQIIETIYMNPYVSRSHHAEWTGNLKSAGNVTTDVSNIERLNRWHSGVKMFMEKPVTGFGPGTYQFVYIPYQKPELMNRLTVKNPWNIPENSGGTAHSEYILALSEMGLIGFLALILFLARLFRIAFAGARPLPDRSLITVAFAVLSTYLFHAMFNNFLNIDKFAFLFWGMAAWLMAVYERNDGKILLRS